MICDVRREEDISIERKEIALEDSISNILYLLIFKHTFILSMFKFSPV